MATFEEAVMALTEEGLMNSILNTNTKGIELESFTPIVVNEKLPTVEAKRNYLLKQGQSDVYLQAYVLYYDEYSTNNLINIHSVSEAIYEVMDTFRFTNDQASKKENRKQVISLINNENDLETKVIDVCEDIFQSHDLDEYDEDFDGYQLFKQLMVYMIYYNEGGITYNDLKKFF